MLCRQDIEQNGLEKRLNHVTSIHVYSPSTSLRIQLFTPLLTSNIHILEQALLLGALYFASMRVHPISPPFLWPSRQSFVLLMSLLIFSWAIYHHFAFCLETLHWYFIATSVHLSHRFSSLFLHFLSISSLRVFFVISHEALIVNSDVFVTIFFHWYTMQCMAFRDVYFLV